MHGKFRLIALLAVFVLSLGIAGCGGSDGDDGAPGPQGDTGEQGEQGEQGEPGESAVFSPVESCAVCHSAGSIGDAVASHKLPPIESVSNVTFAVNDPDLLVTFDLKADGVAATGYNEITRFYRYDGTTVTSVGTTPLTLTENATAGNYTITVSGGAAEAATDNRYLFRVGVAGDSDTTVYFYGDFPASPVDAPVVSAEACTNCHGPEGIDIHGGYFAAVDGAETCLTCHGAADSTFTFLGEAPPYPVPGLWEVAHQYHSSLIVDGGEIVEVTYPSYMNNCSVCHEPPDNLAAANTMPVQEDTCFSCHGSFEGMFAPTDPLLGAHQQFGTACGISCHADGLAASDYQLVTDVHNGAITERGGIIWNGEDTSVTEGALFDVRITGVADDGTDLTITWEADYAGAGVNPCNDTVGPGAPIFHLPGGGGGGNWSVLRNYAQGEDFILGLEPNEAGQPLSVGMDAENTTCSGNVATTVVPVEVDATYATVGRVGLQGKPAVVAIDPADTDGLMRVRAKSATYDWVIGTDDKATDRRAIVNTTEKCLKCHVGSLYQHGGNRVDNVDLCILCHNSAANEQYVREGMGVDPSEAYDGQAGELFEMKTMLHAVHASGRTAYSDLDYEPAQVPFVIYRGRGIYAWAADESLVPNWPTEPDCTYTSGGQELPGNIVFGSDPDAEVRDCQPHNFHTPTFPRGLYDCDACHADGFATLFPDPTKAMASTVETGEDFGGRLDDVLEGASSATCMTCHKQWSSADKAEYNALGSHAAQNGWEPQEFEEGRQTIIEANQ